MIFNEKDYDPFSLLNYYFFFHLLKKWNYKKYNAYSNNQYEKNTHHL